MGPVSAFGIEMSNAEFEILKIFLDKGAIALLLAICVLLGDIYLEKFKAAIKMKEYAASIQIPAIQKLLDDADTLYIKGLETIDNITDAFSEMDSWAQKIYIMRARFASDEYNYDDFKEPRAIWRQVPVIYNHQQVSLQDFLLEATTNDFLKKILGDEAIWISEKYYKEGEFLNIILKALNQRGRIGYRTDLRSRMPMALAVVLVDYNKNYVKEYSDLWENHCFRLLKNFPTNSWRNKGSVAEISVRTRLGL